MPLLSLLRAGLWENTPYKPKGFPLNHKQWEELLVEAKRQTVTGIVYQGILRLPEEWLPPQTNLIKWVAEVDRIERNNHQMDEALHSLLYIYKEYGLSPMVLKGQGIAAMYSNPSLRECGDIDLYFSREEDLKAKKVLAEKGIDYETHADGSICYQWHSIEVEHHPTLIDLHTPQGKRFLRHFIPHSLSHSLTHCHSHSHRLSHSYSHCLTTPPPELNLLLLSTHILKHAIGVGVGLRQFCDMARAYHYYQGTISLENLRAIYREAGIQKWSIILHAFMVNQLGLLEEWQPYTQLEQTDTAPLTDIIRQGGNFGQHAPNQAQHNSSAWQRKRKTLLAFWQRRHFSRKYAAKEALWTILSLAKGTIQSSKHK